MDPWQAGGPTQDSLEQSETEVAIGKAHLDLLTPSERKAVCLDPVAKRDESIRLRDYSQCLADLELPLDEGGAGRG
jgi:hypothetical protein